MFETDLKAGSDKLKPEDIDEFNIIEKSFDNGMGREKIYICSAIAGDFKYSLKAFNNEEDARIYCALSFEQVLRRKSDRGLSYERKEVT